MHAIWIEIPVTDLHRAKQFYAAVFAHEATDDIAQPDRTIVVIPGEPTVSLNQTASFVPTAEGSVPYFHVDDLDASIAAAVAHGGTVIEAKSERADNGWFAEITDSEGNALYLHGTS